MSKPINEIYIYRNIKEPDWIKIGISQEGRAYQRIKEQNNTRNREEDFQVLHIETALKSDNTPFIDKEIHSLLLEEGFENGKGRNNEWFKCSLDTALRAIQSIKFNTKFTRGFKNFSLRPEQEAAINQAADYFASINKKEKHQSKKMFLWNAKMRFGKTFTAYQLAKKMGWKKILILTFRLEAKGAWQDDLKEHIDFDDWHWIKGEADFQKLQNKSKQEKIEMPTIVHFGSFQNYLGTKSGKIKEQNKWTHSIHWDCIIFDEYHFGVHTDKARALTKELKEEGEELGYINKELLDMDIPMPITADYFLCLSGTPFKALADGEFSERQIFNWTYVDEQKAKNEWHKSHPEKPNPYASLPKMKLYVYNISHIVKDTAKHGQFNEFNLNEFFATVEDEKTKQVTFKHEDKVRKWLDFMCRQENDAKTSITNLKNDLDARNNNSTIGLPFNDSNLLKELNHTLWFFRLVDSCKAMENLLKSHPFYKSYHIINCSGTKTAQSAKMLKKIKPEIKNHPKTITLTCGKLTMGVSVPEWTGVFMLRSITKPAWYFQTAFRVQTPWTNTQNCKEEVLKQQCYVFDFAPNRALKQLTEYACGLNSTASYSRRDSVKDLTHFLPVLAYDGGSMTELDPGQILHWGDGGTDLSMLARRWSRNENVDISVAKLIELKNEYAELYEAICNIEGFKGIAKQIDDVIAKAESIKDVKSKTDISKEQKGSQITPAEKQIKKDTDNIKTKLLQLVRRVPLFVYLSEIRETGLDQVIHNLQAEEYLFYQTTNLELRLFKQLISLGMVNGYQLDGHISHLYEVENKELNYNTNYLVPIN